MNQMIASRRKFLLNSSALALVALFPLGSGFYSQVPYPKDNYDVFLSALIKFFPDTKSTLVIGGEYLKVLGDDLQLGDLLLELPSTLTQFKSSDQDRLFVQMNEHIRMDFKEQNVISMHGWILAKTELILCALLSVYLNGHH